MAYNENLADRTREIIALTRSNVEEKKMFGGLCFMVDDKMCLGVMKENLMVRVDPAVCEDVIELNGARPMDFSGKPMKGYVFVDPEAWNNTKLLKYWISLALDYNKVVKPSLKKRKSGGKQRP